YLDTVEVDGSRPSAPTMTILLLPYPGLPRSSVEPFFVWRTGALVSDMPTSSIAVRYPDGTARRVTKGTTAADALALPAGNLPEGVIAALVDGKPVDLSRPLEADTEISPVTFEMPEGKEIYRHSSAHIMAQAVKD